ncbi:hypothetical protein CCUN_1093 [Campylobacter cuniculorum DSM 23162 = LMG 24588]|uniref:Uncharacterized protein n=1 Tax=Campylobacter cuniculorum DSM 23162 = LMG 24588 TaxID=1121267 RepID=A0A1W6BXD7_9BACT|nr:hypothetical protein CCUN_1093 [Campylobacter cuniculorum DSM 23162 = LMG 24588]
MILLKILKRKINGFIKENLYHLGDTMKILKILYICWIILCVVGWFISPIVGHNPDRVYEFFVMLGWIVFPPMIANLWLFGITRIKKYLIRFFLLLLYYPVAFIIFLIIVRSSF